MNDESIFLLYSNTERVKEISIAVSCSIQLELHSKVNIFGNILYCKCVKVLPIIFHCTGTLRERGSETAYTIPTLIPILTSIYIFLLQIHPLVPPSVNPNISHSVNAGYRQSTLDKASHCYLDFVVQLETNILECPPQFCEEMEIVESRNFSLAKDMERCACDRALRCDSVVSVEFRTWRTRLRKCFVVFTSRHTLPVKWLRISADV